MESGREQRDAVDEEEDRKDLVRLLMVRTFFPILICLRISGSLRT